MVTLGKKSNSLDKINTTTKLYWFLPKYFYQPCDRKPVNIYAIKVKMKHAYYFPLVDFIDRTLKKCEMWTVILQFFFFFGFC